MTAWFPYGNWSQNPFASKTDEYIISDEVRVFPVESSSSDKGMSVYDSIQDIRRCLNCKGASIRLVGLSGVGKTRFAEALFDDRIEWNILDKSSVMYTDMGQEPYPSPLQLIHQIRSNDRPVYLIVDNCSRETHNQLSKACVESEIRLFTIDYDVKDDLPPETSCCRMEPSSPQVIKQIITRRYPYISETDVSTIAGRSEGNARIAIALANTMKENDRLGDLNDQELCERLFQQRNPYDKDLQKVAKICSLVFSFDSTFDDAPDNEINILSGLVEMTPQTFRSSIAEIERRQLIQSRSNWKALLPHALANKLAIEALQEYPSEMLLAVFRKSRNKRLLLSFAHRISYHHNIQTVIGIVRSWLNSDELSGGLFPHSELREGLLRYSAPVCPQEVLSIIENSMPSIELTSVSFHFVYELLRQIGYAPQYFTRVVEVLIKQYVLNEKSEKDNKIITDVLELYYQILLSGTYASIEQRRKILKVLFNTGDTVSIKLGETLLNKALTVTHMLGRDCQFGSHHRDYGYSLSGEEIKQWMTEFLDLACDLIEGGNAYSGRIKRSVATAFSSILAQGYFSVVKDAVTRVLRSHHWTEAAVVLVNFVKRNV